MDLIVLSNRLPFAISRGEDGGWKVEPGSGGLVTALRPVLQNRGGCWIGWPGVASEDLPDAAPVLSGRNYGYELVPVPLTKADETDFYYGFSNEIVWPLFHDLLGFCNFEPRYWAAYERVNRKYGETAAERAGEDDFVWVHDYHLMNVARVLRGQRTRARLGFFLHIPFPSPDMFMKLPWRLEVLRAISDYDLVGFQTNRDRRNFLQCVRLLMSDATISAKGTLVGTPSRDVRVGTFPISIDFSDFEKRGRKPGVIEKSRNLRTDESDRCLVLGVDRLDYTKGIPHKLEAFRELLRKYPDWAGKVTLVQIVVPSREDIPRYREQKTEIESLVGEINGQFTRSGWVPIHYIYRSLEGPRLAAYYLAADVALVTPLKDGMNLVAKEYCATRSSDSGVLVLSEFAGAAEQLHGGALMVNPFDVQGVAAALDRALRMEAGEQRRRVRRMRKTVREHDIFAWLDSYLRAAVSRDLKDFEQTGEVVPEEVFAE
ncbi:MAG TPA: trehalose-6-phosphate synthase [Thermoanaerobaculia bacterium]|nr:trehalose-6-phosphate synthase [Thermoanaerobaculia bacterium]